MNTAVRQFKGQELQEFLEEQILSGRIEPGLPILSEAQLAKRFGISKLTVRKVVDEFVERGLLDRQQGRGTFVTERARRRAKSRKAGTVLELVRTGGHLYGDVLRQVIQKIQEGGFRQSVLGTIPESREALDLPRPIADVLADLESDPVALVCERIEPSALPTIKQIEAQGIPVIWLLIDDVPFGCSHHLVTSDNERGVYCAVEHLVELGHREIVFCTHPTSEWDWLVPERNMRRGWRRAVADFGLWDTASVHEYRMGVSGRNQPVQEEFAALLAKSDQPSAVVVDQDYAATLLVRAATEHGLTIPDDLAVVGYFDTPWAETFGLTSVSLRLDRIADQIVLLLKLLEQDTELESARLFVEPELVIRQSCGAAAGGRVSLPLTAEKPIDEAGQRQGRA